MIFGFINKNYKGLHSAYTLAEMLIVLVIISTVLISLPHATKKLFRIKEVKTYHGRYECYWDRTDENNPVLKYYYVQERASLTPHIEEGIANNGRCEFTPPATYPYIMIHAVAGGGAGGNITENNPEPYMYTAYTEYRPKSEGSGWFFRFIRGLTSSEKTKYNIEGDNAKEIYSTLITSRQVDLKYRKAGLAGKVASVFFPSVPAEKKFYLYPGIGGSLKGQVENGENGGNTIVKIVDSDGTMCDENNEDPNATCNIIYAKGGIGAAVLDSDNKVIDLRHSMQIQGGKASDNGISLFNDVKTKESGFTDITDKMNKEVNLSSKVPSDAGNGGNGANQYYLNTQAGFIFHEFDDYKYGTCGNSSNTCSQTLYPIKTMFMARQLRGIKGYTEYDFGNALNSDGCSEEALTESLNECLKTDLASVCEKQDKKRRDLCKINPNPNPGNNDSENCSLIYKLKDQCESQNNEKACAKYNQLLESCHNELEKDCAQFDFYRERCLNSDTHCKEYHELEEICSEQDEGDDPDCTEEPGTRTCTAGESGVNWVPISNNNIRKAYSSSCQLKNSNLSTTIGLSDGFWITRKAINDISTQCVPDDYNNPQYFYCTVGYMKRNFKPNKNVNASVNCTNACESSASDYGKCACFAYHLDSGTYTKVGTTSNFSDTQADIEAVYKAHLPITAEGGKAYIEIEERISDDSHYLYCPIVDGYEYKSTSGDTTTNPTTPCSSGSANFNSTKGICNASRGGDGAVVILW